MSGPIPVIAIDGPSASGKGTVAQLVARSLGFHYLDSGALYRLTALAARRARVSLDDEAAVARVAAGLQARFQGNEVFLDDARVADDIRTEECSEGASTVAAFGAVRAALLERQRAFRQPPGLVAEGRDMGTVVFPDATLKVFLTASAGERAERRHKQLKEKGITATLPDLLQDLRERDARDAARSVAPLRPGLDARWLDTTAMDADRAAAQILKWHSGDGSPGR